MTKIFRQGLECITSCMLLPGVEIKFDEVIFYLKQKRALTLLGNFRHLKLK